jgi:hypothetical protein
LEVDYSFRSIKYAHHGLAKPSKQRSCISCQRKYGRFRSMVRSWPAATTRLSRAANPEGLKQTMQTRMRRALNQLCSCELSYGKIKPRSIDASVRQLFWRVECRMDTGESIGFSRTEILWTSHLGEANWICNSITTTPMARPSTFNQQSRPSLWAGNQALLKPEPEEYSPHLSSCVEALNLAQHHVRPESSCYSDSLMSIAGRCMIYKVL